MKRETIALHAGYQSEPTTNPLLSPFTKPLPTLSTTRNTAQTCSTLM